MADVTTSTELKDLFWVEAGDGYAVALDGGKVICKNAKGKLLGSLPKKVREKQLVEELRDLRQQLALHEQECKETVETWMVRSLPVPMQVLEAVWPDPAWRSVLENSAIWPLDKSGKPNTPRVGFLRSVDAKRGIGVVDLDGESRWLKADALALPHPILLQDDLMDFRELAMELSLEQGLPQLFRETFMAEAEQAEQTSIESFSGGEFEMLTHATARARKQGYRVSGGYAVCTVWEDGAQVEARFWIGADYPDEETQTGDLGWVDAKDRSLTIAEVGPVAYSEGMRMASQIYAGRRVEKKEEE